MKNYKLISLFLLSIILVLSSCTKTDKPELPQGLGYHQMAYDEESRVSVIYGGQPRDYEMVTLSTTWGYSSLEGSWARMRPKIKPPPSSGDAIAYDSKSDKIIFFSGQQTWAYDYNHNTWLQKNPPTSPVSLFGPCMAYDSESDVTILYGLSSNQTWAYNYEKDQWKSMNPPLSPGLRQFSCICYDSESDRIILYGGGSGNAAPFYTYVYADTWTYDYNTNTWEEIKTDSGPGKRVYHTMAYVPPPIDKVMLFGGWSFDDKNPPDKCIWQFDTNSGKWEIFNSENNLSLLRKHSMIYDSSTNSLIFFGGISGPINITATPRFSDKLYLFKIE